MGRKKSRPVRSSGAASKVVLSTSHDLDGETSDEHHGIMKVHSDREIPKSRKPIFVEVDRGNWSSSDEHFDIAEVVLKNIKYETMDYKSVDLSNVSLESSAYLRFRLPEIDDSCLRLGHFPVISADDIFLELYVLEDHSSGNRKTDVLLSGIFDGPDESISGLVHLVSLKLVTLRPLMECTKSTNLQTFRSRVGILRSAFDSCESLVEIPRQPWRKSMMKVMNWLRPEVTTSEAKYRVWQLGMDGLGKRPETYDDPSSRAHSGVNVRQLYEAIKPSKEAPMLEEELPDLLLHLRPYQRRAVYWMIQREKGFSGASGYMTPNKFFAPVCVPVVFLDRNSRMFYNPFCGTVSLHPESCPSHVFGGILADEMGLGKTVELLACIFSHHMPFSEDTVISEDKTQNKMKRIKRERVECICGAVTESYKYKGLWVQCDTCDAWQHADCVGFSPKKKPRSCTNVKKEEITAYDPPCQGKRGRKVKKSSNVTETDGEYVCLLCSELFEAACSTIKSSATLIVCPTPILAQWHSEITRHTRPGSLKVCIYEGARNLDSQRMTAEMTKFVSADIVLTTYDVLKEDLSHDSDRHEGDRRCMRFQKRYPVIPTLLTRICWWRLCLDEAQMVESNTAAVTEMALRLRAQHHWCITGTPLQRRLDDIYGLLRFLNVRPFDVYRWWSEVIRDPYERGDMMAVEFAHDLFKQIMWRSSKVDVSNELGLPPQEACITWLSFSSVEEHFYRKQHETCMGHVHENIEHLKHTHLGENSVSGMTASCDVFLSHREAARLLFPLLKLRQACCHPQIGSSGLRSLQQSPMTMDEILQVLISKTKTEGEEALRKIIIAINGLAAIAVIEKHYSEAITLYREALSMAAENSDNFRVDPLVSLHIYHNLADLLPISHKYLQTSSYLKVCTEISEENILEDTKNGNLEDCDDKKKGKDALSGFDVDGCSTEQPIQPNFIVDLPAVDEDGINYVECDVPPQASRRPFTYEYLRKKCEEIKQKYLSGFISKMSFARQEFINTYTQVCNIFNEYREQHEGWWLQVLTHIEQNKDFWDGLSKKIDQAVSRTVGGTGSSRISSRFRSITSLRYALQTGLDSLETSRKAVLERLLEIDKTMGIPKEDDIERVRFCPNCQSGEGSLCIHCELDNLFQLYEARLFHLKKGNSMVASAEEAIDLQKKKNELNLFFRSNRTSTDSKYLEDTSKGQRHSSMNVVVSRSPSDLEVIFGVIKGYSKSKLGRDGALSATKQLLLFEAMRKEFAHARYLSRAQAQLLCAHDEINMSTSRLRLRETEDEPTATNVLSKEELIPSNIQFSGDKFMSLSSLARIKGQLRYLKGLVLSKQKEVTDAQINPHEIENLDNVHSLERKQSDNAEPCPICHEKLGDQKMVFQCGHVTCCKCFLELTEQKVANLGKCQQKWVMCPTCRQHTDFGDVAYVVDKNGKSFNRMVSNSFQSQDISEMSIEVQGSYGTKVEAIIRKILWIRSIDQDAKLLIFSSWNDVLDVLEHAFVANTICYVRMKGGRKSQAAVAKFKESCSRPEDSGSEKHVHDNSKPIQVLLLLIQHGANGLNLLEAQHVILVEPLLNPAAEEQAINRVHRVGQEKKTFVYRFFVKNTVEESIHKLNRDRTVNGTTSSVSKHQDQPHLTLKDIETLFSPVAPLESTESDTTLESLRHLPPAVAAGLAAEKRLMESTS